jgi:hypothetical protein
VTIEGSKLEAKASYENNQGYVSGVITSHSTFSDVVERCTRQPFHHVNNRVTRKVCSNYFFLPYLSKLMTTKISLKVYSTRSWSEGSYTLDAEFWNTGRRALIWGAENAGFMISRWR